MLIERDFPTATNTAFTSVIGAFVGQADLNKAQFDPRFTIIFFRPSFRTEVTRSIKKPWRTSNNSYCLLDHVAGLVENFCDPLEQLLRRGKDLCPM